MRRNQLIRQWQLLQRIEACRAGFTVDEIRRDAKVSMRTVYRDLADLQAAGFPLHSEKIAEETRWCFVEGFRLKTPRPIRATELIALYLARDMLGAYRGTVFSQDLENLIETVESGLAPETRAFLADVRNLYHTAAGPWHHYGRRAEIVARLNQALCRHRTLDIAYQALSSPERTLRRIDPYGLYFNNSTLYLVAFCHRRQDLRTFVVDRISMLQTTERRFCVPVDFELKRYLADSFSVMRGPLVGVRIRISPAWARYVGERQWHSSQYIQQQIDGGIEIGFRVAGLEEIRQWVLALGPEARVLDPPELKAALRDSLARTLDQYPADEDQDDAGMVPQIFAGRDFFCLLLSCYDSGMCDSGMSAEAGRSPRRPAPGAPIRAGTPLLIGVALQPGNFGHPFEMPVAVEECGTALDAEKGDDGVHQGNRQPLAEQVEGKGGQIVPERFAQRQRSQAFEQFLEAVEFGPVPGPAQQFDLDDARQQHATAADERLDRCRGGRIAAGAKDVDPHRGVNDDLVHRRASAPNLRQSSRIRSCR